MIVNMAGLNLTESIVISRNVNWALFLLAGRDLKEFRQSTGLTGRRLFESIICQEKYEGMS